MHPAGIVQAREVNSRGHVPPRCVAGVPMHPVGTGGLHLVHQGAYALPEEVVYLQAHRSVCVQTIGDDGAGVEGVGRVGRQARRLGRDRRLGRRACDVGHRQRVGPRLVPVARYPRVIGPALRWRERHAAITAAPEVVVVAAGLVASLAVVDRPEIGVAKRAAPARAARQVELVGAPRLEIDGEPVLILRDPDGARDRATNCDPSGGGIVVGQVCVALRDALTRILILAGSGRLLLIRRRTPHRRRDTLRQCPTVLRADRGRGAARRPGRERHRHVTVRVRLDRQLPQIPAPVHPAGLRRPAPGHRHDVLPQPLAVHPAERLAERHPERERRLPVMLRRHALERRRQLRRTLVQTPHRRRDVLRQRPPVRRADRARLVARAPRRQRHRHVTVRVRLDLDLPHDLPVLAAHRAFPCAARRIAAYGAHRRHFAALDFHAVRAHVLRRLAERHPDLDRLRPVVLIWRRREPRPQRHPPCRCPHGTAACWGAPSERRRSETSAPPR